MRAIRYRSLHRMSNREIDATLCVVDEIRLTLQLKQTRHTIEQNLYIIR